MVELLDYCRICLPYVYKKSIDKCLHWNLRKEGRKGEKCEERNTLW